MRSVKIRGNKIPLILALKESEFEVIFNLKLCGWPQPVSQPGSNGAMYRDSLIRRTDQFVSGLPPLCCSVYMKHRAFAAKRTALLLASDQGLNVIYCLARPKGAPWCA